MKMIFFFVFILALSGCAVQESVHTKDGKEYGVTEGLFRDRWWNYYERGLSLAEGEFYDEAMQDLGTAIAQRNDDQWRSRTYGMHLKFSHRRSVSSTMLNKFNDAVREPESSNCRKLKAKYFLNRARAYILNQTEAIKSSLIRMDYPPTEIITNKSSITLNGHAKMIIMSLQFS
jgi:hypothetical protein